MTVEKWSDELRALIEKPASNVSVNTCIITVCLQASSNTAMDVGGWLLSNLRRYHLLLVQIH